MTVEVKGNICSLGNRDDGIVIASRYTVNAKISRRIAYPGSRQNRDAALGFGCVFVGALHNQAIEQRNLDIRIKPELDWLFVGISVRVGRTFNVCVQGIKICYRYHSISISCGLNAFRKHTGSRNHCRCNKYCDNEQRHHFADFSLLHKYHLSKYVSSCLLAIHCFDVSPAY